jgi:hypothetical protein
MAPIRAAAFLAAVVLAAAVLPAARGQAEGEVSTKAQSLAVDLYSGASTVVTLNQGGLARTADVTCPDSNLIQCFCRNDGSFSVSEIAPITVPDGRRNRVRGRMRAGRVWGRGRSGAGARCVLAAREHASACTSRPPPPQRCNQPQPPPHRLPPPHPRNPNRQVRGCNCLFANTRSISRTAEIFAQALCE